MRRGLIAARKAKRLTQKELAEIINVHRTSLTKYETGTIDIPGRVLIRLAAYLHRPMEKLYAKEPEVFDDMEESLPHA